jgi:hypothetical protein
MMVGDWLDHEDFISRGILRGGGDSTVRSTMTVEEDRFGRESFSVFTNRVDIDCGGSDFVFTD